MVLPALHRAPARGGRDDAVRPVLVQPGGRGARDGLLHQAGVRASSCTSARSSSGCWSRTASCCASTGSRSATPSSRSGSSRGSTTRCGGGSCRRWTWSRSAAGRTYSRAKDDMFTMTDIPEAPWFVVESDDKRRARINMIAHLLSTIPYQDVPEPTLKLPQAAQVDRVRADPAGDADLRPRSRCGAGQIGRPRKLRYPDNRHTGRVSDGELRRRAADSACLSVTGTGRDAR